LGGKFCFSSLRESIVTWSFREKGCILAIKTVFVKIYKMRLCKMKVSFKRPIDDLMKKVFNFFQI